VPVEVKTDTIAERQNPTLMSIQVKGEDDTSTPTSPIETPRITKPLLPALPLNQSAYKMPDFYGCEMILEFTSGPLKNKDSSFTVLDKSYFLDKGDKFDIGKGTGIYYEDNHYFILHSSFVNGNMLRPMEAEFLRRYLENWGNTETSYIKDQMDNLIGAEMIWHCNGETALNTKLNGIVRLSHEASERLWLEPHELPQIIIDKEGDQDQWIGNIEESTKPSLYIGFCGWGPESLGSKRYTYYRYLIQFEVIP
jgi:hypothetical protein